MQMKEHEVEEALSHEVEDRRLYWVQMIHVDRYWIAVQMIGKAFIAGVE